MAGTMWMATEQYGQWIPCPRINMQAGKVSWGVVSKYLNGGNHVRRSLTAAKEYTIEWPLKSRDLLRPILDFADGFYGTGDIYFTDPFAMDKNVLPAYWAAPYLNAIDGPLVSSSWSQWPPTANGIMSTVSRPTLTQLSGSTSGFPIMSGGIKGVHRLFVPVPQGYTIHLSIHHTSASAGGVFKIQPYVAGATSGSVSTPAISTLSAAVLTGFTYAASAAHAGIEISTTGDVNYTGMMAQIHKTGTSPNTAQPFVSGQGHSGLQFGAPGVGY
jgi:hypothetical protein